jgi:hypothetical protein
MCILPHDDILGTVAVAQRMPCEIAKDLVRVRRDDRPGLFVGLNQSLERPQVVRLATDNTKHVLRDLVVSRCLRKVTVERKSDASLQRRELALLQKGQILIEGPVRLIGCRPTGTLFAAKLWIEREREVKLASSLRALEEITERSLDLLEKSLVLVGRRILRAREFGHSRLTQRSAHRGLLDQ